MSTESRRGDEMKIAERAAEWISELDEGSEKRAEFFEWLKASPRHVEETLFVLSISREASLLEKDQSEELLADIKKYAAADALNVVPLPNTADRPAISSKGRFVLRRRWVAGIAAGVSLIGITWLLMSSDVLEFQGYSTKTGEQRSIVLEDGSLVQLNTRSRLKVNFSSEKRELRLIAGEALFTVKRDPSRPFRVRTDDAVVQALGTQFNVYHRAGDTQVSVIEGLVQVSTDTERSENQTERVAAGQRIDVTKGKLTQRASLNVAKATSWHQRRLVFENDTLSFIADEFNRYNAQTSIEVDPRVANERFTGTFDADTPDTFISALAAHKEVEVERSSDKIVIKPR